MDGFPALIPVEANFVEIFEDGRKRSKLCEFASPPKITNFAILVAFVSFLSGKDKEFVIGLFVRQNLELISLEYLSFGTENYAKVDIGKIILRGRILDAAGFFLAHNHPSGNPHPSTDDLEFTRRLSYVANCCNVPLISHVIVASGKVMQVGY